MTHSNISKEQLFHNQNFLIIGGTTKAATTSVFDYLSDHPQISPSLLKETRFFLEENYPLPSRYRYQGTISDYQMLFSEFDDDQVLMEATPDYLYSNQAPKLIQQWLPNAKVLFVLRDPITRLKSWFGFAKQIGSLPNHVSFEDYVESQVHNQSDAYVEQYRMSMQQGLYAGWLSHYLGTLGNEKVLVVFFEDLVERPSQVMTDVCRFCGIDELFYDDYIFNKKNETKQVQFQWMQRLLRFVRLSLRSRIIHFPKVRFYLKIISVFVSQAFHKNREKVDVEISPEMLERLENFYRDDAKSVSQLLGRSTPWEWVQK